MTNGSNYPFQHKPGIEMELFRKDSLEAFCLHCGSHNIHGRLSGFLRMLYRQKHCQLGSKGAESRSDEMRL